MEDHTTGSGKKGGMVRESPMGNPQRSPEGKFSPMGSSTDPQKESAQKQVPGPQSSPGVASEMLQSGGELELESVCRILKGGSKFYRFLGRLHKMSWDNVRMFNKKKFLLSVLYSLTKLLIC